MESQSQSIVQIEPVPDNYDYYVISNLKTLQGDARALKHTDDEKLILMNTGQSIVVQRISASRGLDERRHMELPVFKSKAEKTENESAPVKPQEVQITPRTLDGTELKFIDFCPLDNDKVITVNNLGQLQVFEFRIDKKKFRKIFEQDLTQICKNRQIKITTIALSSPQNFLALAVSDYSNFVEGVLDSVFVYHVSSEKPLGMNNKEGIEYLNLISTHKCLGEKPRSSYNFLNFDYHYKGLPLLIAMQKDGDLRLDAFVLEDPEDSKAKLSLKARKVQYHNVGFKAVGIECGEIISVDFNGVMRRLKLPE